MIDNPKHATAGLEHFRCGCCHDVEVLHVLHAEDGGSGVELAEVFDLRRIACEVAHRRLHGIGPRLLNQSRCGIHAGHLATGLRKRAAEHALSAAEIEHALAALRREQFERAGNDDGLIELRSALADDAVVPVGGFLPRGAVLTRW